MRKLPTDKNGVECTPPAVTPDLSRRQAGGQTTQLITCTRQYALITPLFGGGVEPGVADPVTVIRGSGIRGHLRFWWRACRGGQFGGILNQMKAAEDDLWGAASTAASPCPSRVEVGIVETERGTDETPYTSRTRTADEWRNLAYAAFPLAPDEGRPARVAWHGVKFRMSITYPLCVQREVEAALWAWETFGGLGARTRRGFGALQLVSVNGTPVALPLVNDAGTIIRSGLLNHVLPGPWPPNVSYLDCMWNGKITAPQTKAYEAWKFLIRKLKAFRQEPLGRTPPSGIPPHPGRSQWPEPDAIRRLFLPGRVPKHTPLPTMPNKFPRAAFGLPIIFKFKSDDEAAGDPTKTTLEGQLPDRKRFASPLILRPLACSGGQAVGLAVILQGSSLPLLVLKDAPGNPTVNATLTLTEASAISPLGGNVNVLQAFLNTL